MAVDPHQAFVAGEEDNQLRGVDRPIGAYQYCYS